MVKKGRNSLRGKDVRDRDNFRKVDELQNMIKTNKCCHIQFIEKKKPFEGRLLDSGAASSAASRQGEENIGRSCRKKKMKKKRK